MRWHAARLQHASACIITVCSCTMRPMLHSSGRTLLAAVVALFGVQVLCTCNAPGAAGAGCDLGVSRQLVFNPLYMEWCYDAGRRTCWWQRLPKQTLVLVGGVRMSCQVGYACTAVSAGRLVGEAPQQGLTLSLKKHELCLPVVPSMLCRSSLYAMCCSAEQRVVHAHSLQLM